MSETTSIREKRQQAGVDPYSIPLDEIDVSDPELFVTDTWGPYFARLRKEAPVHYHDNGDPRTTFWSVTKFNDIVQVDSNHQLFSSEPTIVLEDPAEDFPLPMFIAMDQPKHDDQRRVVQPAVAPRNLAAMEATIRERAAKILDVLPVGETFDWVDKVSIELTTQMLATLFDFPFEDRRKLTYWSDMTTVETAPGDPNGITEDFRRAQLFECLEYFGRLWQQRADAPPANDLISMMAHDPATRDLPSRPMEFLGNLVLLIVGGNDTTRNSISGGVVALNKFPNEYAKLRNNPKLIPSMVSEIIRYQTPLAHMRRTALVDTTLGGQQIRKGDRVAMWYVSGNRDEEVIDRPDDFIIDRANPRHHVSFGFGIHRCMGNRLAEMQLRIVWEEINKRFQQVEVVGEPVRVRSSFVKGFAQLPVRVHPI